MNYDLLCLGELLIDFVEVREARGLTALYQANPGGAPGNVACSAQRFGLRTGFIGAVGNDAFGRLLLDALAYYGVDTRGVRNLDGVMSSLAFVSLTADGGREFSFARKGAADTRLSLDEAHREQIRATRALHFGALSLTEEPARTASLEAVRIAAAQGGIISFDPNVRLNLWETAGDLRAAYRAGLGEASLLKISAEDFAALEGAWSEELLLERLTPYFRGRLRLLLLSLGEEGAAAYWRSDGRIRSVQAPAETGCTPLDTTGAGDIFTGALLSRLLPGLSRDTAPQTALEHFLRSPAAETAEKLRAMLRFANRIAALSTEKHGGIPSIPDL